MSILLCLFTGVKLLYTPHIELIFIYKFWTQKEPYYFKCKFYTAFYYILTIISIDYSLSIS